MPDSCCTLFVVAVEARSRGCRDSGESPPQCSRLRRVQGAGTRRRWAATGLKLSSSSASSIALNGCSEYVPDSEPEGCGLPIMGPVRASKDPQRRTDRWGLDLESSQQLAAARVPSDGLCWWCRRRPATSAEHKYKATDLRRMADLSDQGHPDPASLYRSGATFSGELRTIARGTAVQWSKSMCKTCNGSRDRHMDRAYEVYSDYVWNHQDLLAAARDIDWRTLYGTDWTTAVPNLGRYYAKQVGCLLSQQSLPVPQSLIEFLDGDERAQNFSFTVVRDRGRRTMHRLSRLQRLDARGYWLPPALATLTADGTRVATFSHQPYIGFIGVTIDYSLGLERPSFFADASAPIVQVTAANPWTVRAMMFGGLVRSVFRRR